MGGWNEPTSSGRLGMNPRVSWVLLLLTGSVVQMNLTETSVTTTTDTTTEDDRRAGSIATSARIGTRPRILGRKERHSARIVGHHHFRRAWTNPRVVLCFVSLKTKISRDEGEGGRLGRDLRVCPCVGIRRNLIRVAFTFQLWTAERFGKKKKKRVIWNQKSFFFFSLLKENLIPTASGWITRTSQWTCKFIDWFL